MNHWMSGLNMLQDLSEMATWDEMAQGRGLGGSNGAYFAFVESKYAVDLLFHVEMRFFDAFFAKQHVAFVKLSRTLPSSFTGTMWGNKVRTCQIITMQRPAPETRDFCQNYPLEVAC